MRRAIGIIGGMGPGASAYMYKLLIDMAIAEYGARKNDDFPEIIIHSVPIPDFISTDFKAQFEALDLLKQRVKNFNNVSLSSLSLACNTVHMLIDDLQSVSLHTFVSMIDVVSKEVDKSRIKKVGILATPSTIKFGLYQKELQKYGIEVIIPDKKQILVIERIVRNILAGEQNVKDKKQIMKIADSLCMKGAGGIILGCTELPLIFPVDYKVSVFNSLEILSKTLLRDYYKSNTI